MKKYDVLDDNYYFVHLLKISLIYDAVRNIFIEYIKTNFLNFFSENEITIYLRFLLM